MFLRTVNFTVCCLKLSSNISIHFVHSLPKIVQWLCGDCAVIVQWLCSFSISVFLSLAKSFRFWLNSKNKTFLLKLSFLISFLTYEVQPLNPASLSHLSFFGMLITITFYYPQIMLPHFICQLSSVTFLLNAQRDIFIWSISFTFGILNCQSSCHKSTQSHCIFLYCIYDEIAEISSDQEH